MTDIVEDWLAYLKQRNRSPETIKSYALVMAIFPEPLTCTTEQAEAWWATLNGHAPRTRQRELSSVRSFYRWAQRFDHVTSDPTRRLDPPRQGRRLPAPMSRSDMHKVLAVATPDMRRAVCLGAYAGLRVAEAAALNWADVDVESRRIVVAHGKGDNARAVGLSALLLDELMPNADGNVVTGGGTPYSAAALQRRVNRLIRSAGVNGTFHKLRARFATVALAETGNLLAVSRALGHANVTTTAIYAATSDDTLDVIADAVCR